MRVIRKPCNCRHPRCWLDTLLSCRCRWVCDRHDARIQQA